ncbi:MAG: ExeM/NucH family extracellular endonuclease [Chloroflexi bacterium]|nr:ExeM/NucH family extracellular endonuclease [Chloroflexota bacterium]
MNTVHKLRKMSLSMGIAVLFLLALLAISASTVIADGPTIYQESFETDGEGTRYTTSYTFNDGTSDHYQRTDGSDISNVSGPYSSYDGTYFWAAEDVDDAGGDGLITKTLTLNAVDISGYTNIQFKGLFGAGNENAPGSSAYDAADEFKVEYSVDGGAFQNGVWFSYENWGDATNEPIGLDANFDGVADVNGVNRLGTALQEFGFSIPAGDSVVIRITVSMSSGSEEIAFDNFLIEGKSPFSISKTVIPTTDVAYHGNVTYTVVISNGTTVSDTNALFTDTLPVNTNFGNWIEQPAEATESNDEITWSGTVTNNTAITFSFTAAHIGESGDVVINTAEYSGSVAIIDTATFSVTVPIGPRIEVTKTVTPESDVPADGSGVVTYTINVKNTGDALASGVLLTDTLPTEVDLNTWIISATGTLDAADEITWGGDVAIGELLTWTFSVDVAAGAPGATVINTATVEFDGDLIEDTAVFAYEVTVPDGLVINEVDSDTPSFDDLEFIELYDGGAGNTALDGLVLVLFNGTDDQSYLPAFDLDGYTTDVDGYFVLGNAAVANVDLVFNNNSLQNGADAVALLVGNDTDFPNDTTLVTDTTLIDAIVYDTNDSDDPDLLVLLNASQPQVNEGGAGDKDNHSNQRCPNGSGGRRNTDTYIQEISTPGAANDCMPALVVSKTADPTTNVAYQGEVTYTIALSNVGYIDDPAVLLTDTLPISVTFDRWIEQPAGATDSGGEITWNGSVTTAQIINFSFVVSHTGDYEDVVVNTVEVSGTANADSDDATFTVIAATPELDVSKTGPDTAFNGETVVYEVSIANNGADTATNVILTDTLPISVTYLSDDSGKTCPACVLGASGVITWNVGDILSTDTFLFHLTATVDVSVTQGTVITNEVEASTDAVGDDPANNSDQWETTILDSSVSTPARLLMTEIAVTPTTGEYIEIHNPTSDTIDLSNVYLFDATYANGGAYYYNIVTGADAGGGGYGDFHARFPDGATIPAGAYQTVALNGSDNFFATYGILPTYELYGDGGTLDVIPDMREALPGSINDQGGLTNGGEIAILYFWDGFSDLVTDLDYVVWGDKDEAVDKTGVSIDGPDADSTASTYLADTAIVSQDVVDTGSHAGGNTWQRMDLSEGTETQTGGNGVDGNDETSEDLSNTWCEYTPTPGAEHNCYPVLSVSKTAEPDTSVAYHGPVTYTILLSNIGPMDETGALLTDTLPVSVTFDHWVDQPAGAAENGGEITWNGSVTTSQIVTVSFVVAHNGDYGDTVVNTAEVSGSNNADSADASFTVLSSLPELTISKTGPATAYNGNSIVYEVTIDNAGAVLATNIILTDTLPISVTYDSDDSGLMAYISTIGSHETITWNVGDLMSLGTHSFNLTATVDAAVMAGTIITNEVQVSTDAVGDDPANNDDYWETTIQDSSGLAPWRLLMTEVVVAPTVGEFIEIHNPTSDTVNLANVYLFDATYANGGAYYYNIVSGADAGGGSYSDFHARFPDGATIPAGAYQTVALNGSDNFFATYGVDPTYELYEDGTPDGIADMREAQPGSINGQGGLSNDGEVAVLYFWNGDTDLVTDLDYVVWGDKAEAVDKTGVATDGPDADAIPTTYQNDTAIDSQDVLASGEPHDSGYSSQRQDLAEGAETQTGGNGVDGNDETSEDLSNTWCEHPPTPGAAGNCGSPFADLELGKTVAPTSNPGEGDTITYTLELVNNAGSTMSATNVLVVDYLPDVTTQITNVNNTCGATVVGDVLTWTVSSILPGATATCDIVVEIRTGTDGTNFANYAQVFASDQLDLDSLPGNMSGTPAEDDEAGATVFVGTAADCGTSATLIHDIQGSGDTSPEIDNVHTIEGVVVGDYQDTSDGLSGFYVQEEDTDADVDPMTSEGIFVYDSGFGVNVSAGDLVRVMGEVSEYGNNTQLGYISAITLCGSGNSVTPAAVTLPISDTSDWEPVEGMLINFSQELYVTENYGLGGYGQVSLSVYDRLYNPTNVTTPGAAANALQALNDLSSILLEDANTNEFPDPIIYPDPGLSALNTLRGGYTVPSLTGVLEQYYSYRVQPVGVVNFVADNPRTATPGLASGRIAVASFNVLNYFNGDGMGGGFPTSRGATSLSEFNRQRDKIITAVLSMDADVVGLMEIENDGYDANSAIQDLVNGLNAIAGAGTYALIDPGVAQIGTDEIAVGLIYQPGTVTPVGAAAILDSSFDPAFIDTRNRPVLAQTFEENATDERFTAAVNHLKSKGSACSGDPDMSDGQGNCNLTRTAAMTVEVAWLDTDPTGSGDPDFIILGDLNSYAMEDPIVAAEDAGYTDLLEQFVGPNAYSYVFYGQAGYLDYAMSNDSLTAQVGDATVWHINADEPRILDYNEEEKSPGQLVDLYNADPYRASDHDPVVVGLNLYTSQPTLVITKDVAPTTDVPLGGIVTYTVTIANSGDADATGVVITDELPSEVTFGGYVTNPGGTAQLPVSDVITWEYPVESGGEYTFVFTATVTTDTLYYGADVTNVAYFVSDNDGSGSDDAIFTIEGREFIYLPFIVRQ